jgi:hypothetical protein
MDRTVAAASSNRRANCRAAAAKTEFVVFSKAG